MTEIRPFRGLHYAETDLSALVCPPYDVISPEEQQRLYAHSPFNAVRLEYGETRPEDSPSSNRYTRAAATLREWTERSVLVRDDTPALYVDDQRFSYEGRSYMRRSLFARVRLHDWGEGRVRPHEHTLDRPKEDRIQLLRACRLNISPILSLYRDDDARVRNAVQSACHSAPTLATADISGETHTIRSLTDDRALARLVEDKTLYVIDGHHRYETALAYRNDRSQAQAWSGDEPENFVLMALVAREDPGLVVLPTHRLLRSVALPEDFAQALERDFTVEDVSATARDWREAASSLSKAADESVAIGVALANGRRLILRVRDADDIASRMPDSPPSWRSLDAAVLEAVVLRGILGIDQQSASADGSLEFTHDGEEALRRVESGDCVAAFLLSPASVDKVLSMAEGGERMPQKSTYFYPKLPAGLVMNPLD